MIKTQIAISTEFTQIFHQFFELVAIDYQIETRPKKGEKLYLSKETIERLKTKVYSVHPGRIWNDVIEVLECDDTTIWNDDYFIIEDVINYKDKIISDYPFMHLLYSQLLVCQRVCLQNTVCLICK